MSQKVWFITGAGRGFGRIWAEAALARGDKVAVTARDISVLNDIVERYPEQALALSLDVTEASEVAGSVSQAHRHFGRLDVILNNAGYGLFGAAEEVKIHDVRAEFDTNFFGVLSVIQAVLPILRSQGHGHIISVSSVAGVITHPIGGLYNASKWALEAMHESLAVEVGSFGIKVTLIEPGAYATDFSTPSSLKIAGGLEAYAALREQIFAYAAQVDFGDPYATTDAVLQLVDTNEPPLRLFLGTEGLPAARAAYAARLAEWEKWEGVSNAAQGVSRRQTFAN
ncbi:SDR family NAD(P)-dependent oxidoreductase [Pectobacterium jejuense]|uniref:SDR family NAD(P)-dependent oxidoreductase n=1 Tax=Pectobacterium jejuense TaxID=2974022 RepID=UPI0032EF7C05